MHGPPGTMNTSPFISGTRWRRRCSSTSLLCARQDGSDVVEPESAGHVLHTRQLSSLGRQQDLNGRVKQSAGPRPIPGPLYWGYRTGKVFSSGR